MLTEPRRPTLQAKDKTFLRFSNSTLDWDETDRWLRVPAASHFLSFLAVSLSKSFLQQTPAGQETKTEGDDSGAMRFCTGEKNKCLELCLFVLLSQDFFFPLVEWFFFFSFLGSQNILVSSSILFFSALISFSSNMTISVVVVVFLYVHQLFRFYFSL